MVVHSLSLIASPDDAAVPGDERDTARYPILEIVSGDVCDAPEQEHFSVVVVTDRADNPLERIAEMSFICPVLFITSAVSVMARLAAARAGVAAILTRPTDVSELAEWLNDLVGSHRESPLSVLIVDDDQILAEAYTWTVEDEGIRAIVETDPLAVLGLIGTFDLDLVLLDMGMPNVNGIELAKMIHQSRRHLSLPIVFLSGERELGRQLEARTLGGDDFISKPVAPAHLVSLVRMRADRAIRLRSMMERDSLTGLARPRPIYGSASPRAGTLPAELGRGEPCADRDRFLQGRQRYPWSRRRGPSVADSCADPHSRVPSDRYCWSIGRRGVRCFAVGHAAASRVRGRG